MGETLWRRSEDWVGVQVEDSFVMVSVENGQYVALNRSANAIWQTIETPRTERQICEFLCAQFDVPVDQCAAAVERALAEMGKLGLAGPE